MSGLYRADGTKILSMTDYVIQSSAKRINEILYETPKWPIMLYDHRGKLLESSNPMPLEMTGLSASLNAEEKEK